MNNKFINKRRKKISKINFKFFIFIFLFITISTYFLFNISKFLDLKNLLIQKFSNSYEYNILNVDVSNLTNVREKKILKYFNKFKNKSIFLIPVKSISEEIQKDKWINRVKIVSDYKNTLRVIIEEEVPMGIYSNNNQNILFSNNLIILDILKDKNNFSNLIIFKGQNSINNAIKLISNFEEPFTHNIKSATFIKNRRWNLLLNNNVILYLPEKNITNAIKNYKNIIKNISNKDLEYINSIDLKNNKQVIIKYKY